MESFFRTHRYLVEHLGNLVPRMLMGQIDWTDRLIGIKGTRGVGKTTFLLQFAREYSNVESRECLYVNLNHFFFTTTTIVDFANNFVSRGGKVLLLDQIYKYPDWSIELKECYERFPELHIIFTGSTVMELDKDNEIAKLVTIYNIRGFSYREFLNITLGLNLQAHSLEDIVENHQQIAEQVVAIVNPREYLWDYMHHGYYPFFLEKKNFSENLLKTLNMMLEVDVLSIRQIEMSYLSKLRKLLYLLSSEAPGKPNISKLSIECEISRATVTNYLEYLKSARLINMLYKEGEEFPKKPELVYMHNTNIMFPLRLNAIDERDLHETFFYNQVHHYDCLLNKGRSKGVFRVVNEEEEYKFKIESSRSRRKLNSEFIHVSDDLIVGTENEIPLWMFGFLY